MKRKKLDLSPEKKIITYLITSDEFAKQIMPIFKPMELKSEYAQIVGSWIKEFYELYKTAPNKAIQDIYKEKRSSIRDEDTSDLVADFLAKLSKEYDEAVPNNIEFSVRAAEKYLNVRSLEMLIEDLQDAVQKDDELTGQQLVANYKRVERATGEGVSIAKDYQEIMSAFDEEEEVLLRFPGVFGDVAGDLHRGDFFSFFAPQKRGKCLAGDSLILLSDGSLVKIEDLYKDKQNRKSVSIDKSFLIKESEISEVYNNGLKDVYKITTKTGRQITITANHPLLTFNKEWKSIDDGLSIGDFIAAPRNINVFGGKEIPRDHVRMIAYLLADGGLTLNTPTYTKKDPILMKDIIRIIHNMGDSTKLRSGNTIAISKGHKSPKASHIIEFLDNYNIPRSKSIYKVIPDVIFTLKKELIAEFLKILFSGDGSCYVDGIDYSSGSETLIRQVQHLLLRFGIVSTIRRRLVKGVFYWVLLIRDNLNIKKFYDKIGFFGKKEQKAKILIQTIKAPKKCYIDVIPCSYRTIVREKVRKSGIIHRNFKGILDSPSCTSNLCLGTLKNINGVLKDQEIDLLLNADVLWDKIVSITYEGKQQTYDLTVPVYHNFIANDICAHNTYFLWFTAELAQKRGLKVVFFSLEMTKKQILRRAWRSLTGTPRKAGIVKIPYFEDMDDGSYAIRMKEVEKQPCDVSEIKEKQKIMRKLYRGGDVRIIPLLGYGATVSTLEAHLDNLNFYDDFIPDLIVVDYADLLFASKKAGKEVRHQLDDIWKGLRNISLSRNLLVVTASQTNKQTFDRDIKEGDGSEDSRKIGHITSGVAINRKKSEIELGAVRIAQLVAREERATTAQAIVLQCLDIGKPYIDSRIYKNPEIDEKRKK